MGVSSTWPWWYKQTYVEGSACNLYELGQEISFFFRTEMAGCTHWEAWICFLIMPPQGPAHKLIQTKTHPEDTTATSHSSWPTDTPWMTSQSRRGSKTKTKYKYKISPSLHLNCSAQLATPGRASVLALAGQMSLSPTLSDQTIQADQQIPTLGAERLQCV